MKKDSILRIYEATIPVFGKLEAREYLALTISHLILDLEEAGALTDENFKQAVLEHADWTEQAAEKAIKEKNGLDVA